MRIPDCYKLRELAGECIVVKQGTSYVDMTRIISLNITAKLFERMSGHDFTLDETADLLADTFGIGREQALNDATAWADALIQCGVIRKDQ